MSHSILVCTGNNIPTHANAYKTEPNHCTNYTKYPQMLLLDFIRNMAQPENIICVVTLSPLPFLHSIVYFQLSLWNMLQNKMQKKKTFHRNLYSIWISHRRRVVPVMLSIWWMVNVLLFSFVHFFTSILLPFTVLSFDPTINMVPCSIRLVAWLNEQRALIRNICNFETVACENW